VSLSSPLFRLIAVAVTAHVALGAARVTTALYALSLQASAFTVGTLIALFALVPMMLAVPMGRAIDRIGMRKPLMIGCLLASAGVLLAATVSGLPVLYAAAMLIGTGFMAIFIGTQHAVGVMSLPEQRTANFSRLSLGFSISSFTGPLIAGFMIDHVSYSFAYLSCGLFTLTAFGLTVSGTLTHISTQPVTQHIAKGSPLQLLRNRELRRVYIIGILLAAGWDMFTFVTPVHGSQLGFSASTIGMILASFAGATFIVRLAMPGIVRRYREWQILTVALTVTSLCYLVFPFMETPITLAATAAVLGLALGTSQPNVLALLHSIAPPGRGAEAIGIRATIGNASSIMMPLAFGAAGATLGMFVVFWSLSLAIAAGVPLAASKAMAQTRKKLSTPQE
jgi:MFS family permease